MEKSWFTLNLQMLRQAVKNRPNRAKQKGSIRNIQTFIYSYMEFRVLYYRFLAFSGVLEGLGRSGRLVGSISTILVPISARGHEVWPKTLLREFLKASTVALQRNNANARARE